MASTTTPLTSRPAAIPDRDRRGRVIKAAATANGREWSVTAALTYPVVDLAGDYVNPTGFDVASHARDLWVDLEHGASEVGRAPVGWCRKSLSKPGEPYAFDYGVVEVNGKDTTLPFVTTYFDPDDRLQAQVFALCERDALPGVSVEFQPIPGLFKSLGHKALVPRPYPQDACHFERVNLVRYTHCAVPVCEGALVLTDGVVRKALRPDALVSILSANRLGGEQLHDTIRKSLSHYLPTGKSTTVRGGYAPAPVVEKADMDQYQTPDAPADAPPEDAPAPALGGIAALYAKAQALLDACTQNESDMETSDSPELRAKAEKWRGKIEAIAEEIKGAADAHDAKLNKKDGDGEESEGEEESEPADPDMDVDDDGMLKAIRAPYLPILKACRVKRYSLADVRKAKDEAKAPEVTPGDSPEDVAYLDKQLKLYERDLRRYG